MWSFLILLGLWLWRIKDSSRDSKFESSTIYAILYYTLVLVLEAIYLVTFLIWENEFASLSVINKVAELGS